MVISGIASVTSGVTSRYRQPEKHTKTTAHHHAVGDTQNRLGKTVNVVVHPIFPGEKAHRFLRLFRILNGVIEFADVSTGAEGSLARAPDNHDTDPVVLGPPIKNFLGLLDHVLGKRIERAWGVERQNTDVAFATGKFLGLYRH